MQTLTAKFINREQIRSSLDQLWENDQTRQRDIATMNTNITTIETQITTLETQITTLETKITTMQRSLSTITLLLQVIAFGAVLVLAAIFAPTITGPVG
jgi:predicted  nucleic acid-binding Zn-ribbon protein